MNPIEHFTHRDELDLVLDQFEKTASRLKKSEQDYELWRRWNDNGRRPEDLDPLYKQIKPVVRKASNVYANRVNIPREAIESEFEYHALNALDNYDPSKSALHTHLTNQMKRGKRFITTHQNVARIPEHRIHKKGEFDRAKSDLMDNLGREPSAQEISDKMKWPRSQVDKLISEDRKDVLSSTLQTSPDSRFSEEQEIMNMLPAELDGEENLVYEYLTGTGGKPSLGANEIASELKISPAKVSRIRSRIASKVKNYYG